MKLTIQEERIARLALDKAAQPGEIASAANKLICSWRSRKITAEQISWNEVTFIDRVVYQDRIVQAPPLPPEIIYRDRVVYADQTVNRKTKKGFFISGFLLSSTLFIGFLNLHVNSSAPHTAQSALISSSTPRIAQSTQVAAPITYTLSELKQHRKEWAQEKEWAAMARVDKKIAEMEAKNQTKKLEK